MNKVNDKIAYTQNVYVTDDYTKFGFYDENRDVDEGHVKRLMKKIEKEGNYVQNFPIEVSPEFKIYDGQHRLEACKRLKQPIYYTVHEAMPQNIIIIKNTGQKNWTWRDYTHFYAKRGVKSYIDFQKLMEKYPNLTFHVLVQLCSVGVDKRRSTNDFKEGDFILKDKEFAMRYAAIVDDYLQLSQTICNSVFCTAIMRFVRTPGYNHNRMLSNLALYGQRLRSCYLAEDYMIALNEIYEA